MSKVITLSRKFPAYMPNAGEPTYFVESFYNWFWNNGQAHEWAGIPDMLHDLNPDLSEGTMIDFMLGLETEPTSGEKKHTIRAGHRWKEGETASIRCWTGKPYHSKQIILAPDVQLKNVFSFEVKNSEYIFVNDFPISPDTLCDVAENDGLSKDQLLKWFKFPNKFCGQVLCWASGIKYPD